MIRISQITGTEAQSLNNSVNWSLNLFFFLPEHVAFGLTLKSWTGLKTSSVKSAHNVPLRKHNPTSLYVFTMIFTLAPALTNKLGGQEPGKDPVSYTLPSRLNMFSAEQTLAGIFLVKLINSCRASTPVLQLWRASEGQVCSLNLPTRSPQSTWPSGRPSALRYGSSGTIRHNRAPGRVIPPAVRGRLPFLVQTISRVWFQQECLFFDRWMPNHFPFWRRTCN